MKGYQTISQSVTITTDQGSFRLAPLVLQAEYNGLAPVTIFHIRPVTIAGDTVSYHAAAFPVRDGSEVEDILKRLPGVEVDMNSNIIIQGKKISKVLVDGKEFFGNDVLLAIRNLPADVVDKLQVIDDFGDKAHLTGVRSGNAAKVLNIVLKADKREGQFGNAEAGGGDEGKYITGAFANAFKGERQMAARAGLSNNSQSGSDLARNEGVDYADQWSPRWGGSISMSNKSQSPHSAGSTVQNTYYPGEQLQQTQETHNTAHNKQTQIDSRITYKPDAYSTLRLIVSGNLQGSHTQATSQFSTLQQDTGFTRTSNGSSLNNSLSAGETLNSNLYFERQSQRSRRRLSIEAGAGYNGNNSVSNNQSVASVTTDSVFNNSLLHYLTGNNVRNWNMHINSTYFLPLGRIAFLELGYGAQSAISHTIFRTQQPDSAASSLVTIDSLSQNLILSGTTQNFHTGYTAKLHQLDLTASLNVQSGQQRGTVDAKGDVTSYTYFSLLPNLQTAWNFDKNHRLSLSYRSQPNLPSLQQLAPFTNVSNPQYPVVGNPDLKPSYTDNISLHYEQSSLRQTQFFGFGMGLAYTATRHTIIQNITAPKDSSQVIQMTTYLNAGTTDNLGADYHINLPSFLEKRLRINVNGTVGRTQTIIMTDSLPYITRTWTLTQSLHLQLLIRMLSSRT